VTVLQHQLGHAKVTTTMTYLHLLDDDVEHAVQVARGQAPRTLPPPIDILPEHYRHVAPEHYRSTPPERATRADGATAQPYDQDDAAIMGMVAAVAGRADDRHPR
jgi:hypothetical protein